MGNGPKAVVAAPVARAPRRGLLPSVTPLETTDGPWANGIIYTPEHPCGTPRTVFDPCDITAGDLDPDPEPAQAEWEAYGLHDGVTCSALGLGGRDWEAVARRRLASVESFQLERELWKGTRAQAAGWSNPFFNDGTADSLTEAGSTGLTHGLACLEQYLAEVLHGQRGMIHATPQVVTHWYGLDLLRVEGSQLLTGMDTIVVAGAGYDGSGPDGQAASDGEVWAYATSLVDVRLGTVHTQRHNDAGSVDRDVNTVEVRAERIGLASFDGCALGAVRLNATLCDIAGGS